MNTAYTACASYPQKNLKTNEKLSSPPGEELHHVMGESVVVQ